ncbi:hypothetical protein [Halioxenophilus sp. WMMB6]|uniref:hypothetical protein n=1 Tax=Halioxenophilus sp. WMMB6 TaxID=3073815 RepID=UPI00295E96C7|nr:hypothetical protein [Halioxenophilus sp. WMMB6]
MSRTKVVFNLIQKWNLLGLFALSLIVTWLLTYQRMLEYITEQGGRVEAIGRAKILWSVLDFPVLIFSALILVVAGIVPIASIYIRPTPKTSVVGQIVWALSIVVLLYVSKLSS